MRVISMSATVLLVLTLSAAPLAANDRDGDGISDRHEEVLGTNPDRPDKLRC